MIISGFVTEPIFPTRHFQAMKPPSKIVITEDETNVEKEPLQARDGWGLCDLIAKAFHQACGQKNALAADHLLRSLEAVYSLEGSHGTERRREIVDLISEMRRDLLIAMAPI